MTFSSSRWLPEGACHRLRRRQSPIGGDGLTPVAPSTYSLCHLCHHFKQYMSLRRGALSPSLFPILMNLTIGGYHIFTSGDGHR